MPEKNQVFIFTEGQLALIKNVFGDNDTLLYTIRKVFLQFPLTDAEKNLLKLSMTPEVMEVLRIRMLPTLDNRFPLGQIPSVLTTLTQELKTKDLEDMALQFEAKEIEMEYLRQRFDVLEGMVVEDEIQLTDLAWLRGKEPRQQFVDMTAYLFLLGYIDPMLLMIKTIAGAKEETPEQQKERMRRDSSK